MKTKRNLFQNLEKLVEVFIDNFQVDLSKEVKDFEFIKQMFQVRHIFEHNMGVIDNDFIKQVPTLSHLVGRKYSLKITDIEKFIVAMTGLGNVIENEIKKTK